MRFAIPPTRSHEVTRPLGCALDLGSGDGGPGQYARARFRYRYGVQLTAVAGARSSAAAEVAGIHDCWLVGVGDWCFEGE